MTNQDRVTELEEDNRRLRRLLDQRDAPGELRHRLRTTLSLLRTIVHRSASTERDLSSYVAHLEDRLDAVTRAQALADEQGEVDLRTLLVDELFQYGASDGERLLLSGPDVKLQPRTGQILALAIHELAVNAVEHGALGADAGRIEVSWSLAAAEPDLSLLFTWTEPGSPPSIDPARRGFGTEVLTRVLPYDLKAETDLAFGPDGLRCTVRFPLPERAG
jgi:two-component sensor histidine kinase